MHNIRNMYIFIYIYICIYTCFIGEGFIFWRVLKTSFFLITFSGELELSAPIFHVGKKNWVRRISVDKRDHSDYLCPPVIYFARLPSKIWCSWQMRLVGYWNCFVPSSTRPSVRSTTRLIYVHLIIWNQDPGVFYFSKPTTRELIVIHLEITSENMFIKGTNFPETKHGLVVNDGRPIKARAAVMGLSGRLDTNKFPSNPERIIGMGIYCRLNIMLNKRGWTTKNDKQTDKNQ